MVEPRDEDPRDDGPNDRPDLAAEQTPEQDEAAHRAWHDEHEVPYGEPCPWGCAAAPPPGTRVYLPYGQDPYWCRHLHPRTLVYCDREAEVAFEYGSGAVGSCRAHLGAVLRVCMGAERGELPIHQVTVWPVPLWREREDAEEADRAWHGDV